MVVDGGFSIPETYRRLTAEGLKVSIPSIEKWVRAWKKGDKCQEDKHKTGRSVTVTTAKNIKRWIKKHYRQRHQSTRGTAYDFKCSQGSVLNGMKKVDLKANRCSRGLFLSPENITARVDWCTVYEDKPASFWKKIVWSDEKWFQTFSRTYGRNDYTWTWRDEQTVTVEERRNGTKIGVWAGINSLGKTYLYFYKTT